MVRITIEESNFSLEQVLELKKVLDTMYTIDFVTTIKASKIVFDGSK